MEKLNPEYYKRDETINIVLLLDNFFAITIAILNLIQYLTSLTALVIGHRECNDHSFFTYI